MGERDFLPRRRTPLLPIAHLRQLEMAWYTSVREMSSEIHRALGLSSLPDEPDLAEAEDADSELRIQRRSAGTILEDE